MVLALLVTMARDHRKLRVFQLADRLIVDLYRASARFPDSERFGLQAQVRRAAVSIAANLVEGCARPSEADYGRFIDIAVASSRECEYLIGLAARLAFLDANTALILERSYGELCAQMLRLRRGVTTSHKP